VEYTGAHHEHGETLLGETLCSEQPSGETLYGDDEFWQFWWNELRARDEAGDAPLVMNVVLPDDGKFTERDWLATLDPDVRSHVIDHDLVTGRVIAPPGVLGSPAEPLIDLGLDSGFEVRLLSVEARFVMYAPHTVVLSESSGAVDVHHAFRQPAVVQPIARLFDLLWQAAVPWQSLGDDTRTILSLLATGLTDEQIARELGLSARTVSRRVAEAMTAHGARSRFQLGVRYASGENI
jgi:AraC-like DNA-binding protein